MHDWLLSVPAPPTFYGLCRYYPLKKVPIAPCSTLTGKTLMRRIFWSSPPGGGSPCSLLFCQLDGACQEVDHRAKTKIGKSQISLQSKVLIALITAMLFILKLWNPQNPLDAEVSFSF